MGPKDCAASIYSEETKSVEGREVHMDHSSQKACLPTGVAQVLPSIHNLPGTLF